MKTAAGPHWPALFPEAWASDWGQDQIGLWMAFTFHGVRYPFRWLHPGRFLMGSPENELGRLENETQHKVTLTKGFWLGETTVTQALWQAVMGANPSRFKGADLPVETVSWRDCQAFMAKLNQAEPDLSLSLPSEAQWECACRANTGTAFHFGPSITTKQVNYRSNFPTKGSPKGVFREKTVAVGELPPNQWGLYQMHGNVWEWCGDWMGNYPAGAQVDPSGPDSGRLRGLRGGSWVGGGWNCRSAYRNGFTPGYRFDFAGFRLARGQKASQ